MNKHTKGPWTANETNQVSYMGDTYNADVVWPTAPGRGPIAFIPLDDPEESVANARLIAAAPQLLDALGDLVEVFPGVVRQTPLGVPMNITLIYEKALQALKAASSAY